MADVREFMYNAHVDRPPLRKRRRKKLLILAIALAAAFLVCLLLNWILSVPKVEAVILSESNDTVYDPGKILEASGLFVGQDLYALSKKDIANNVMKACPAVAEVTVRRRAGGTVVLTVKDRNLWFSIRDGETVYVADQDLRVVATDEGMTDLSFLVRLTLPKDVVPVLGQIPDFGANRQYVETFLGRLLSDGAGMRVGAVNLSKYFDLYVLYDGLYVFRFGNADNLGEKLLMVHAALADETFDGSRPYTVDIRSLDKVVARPIAERELASYFEAEVPEQDEGESS